MTASEKALTPGIGQMKQDKKEALWQRGQPFPVSNGEESEQQNSAENYQEHCLLFYKSEDTL